MIPAEVLWRTIASYDVLILTPSRASLVHLPKNHLLTRARVRSPGMEPTGARYTLSDLRDALGRGQTGSVETWASSRTGSTTITYVAAIPISTTRILRYGRGQSTTTWRGFQTFTEIRAIMCRWRRSRGSVQPLLSECCSWGYRGQIGLRQVGGCKLQEQIFIASHDLQ